jgi:ketosteroid isomerase-like protein
MSEVSERQAANVELARLGLDAFANGRVDEMLSLISEEVEVFGSPELMNSGTFHGHDGFLHWTREWTDAWQEMGIEPLSIDPIGENHVVALVHQRAKGRGGIEVEMDVAFLFEARGGLCTYLALVPNAGQGIELAREREAAS